MGVWWCVLVVCDGRAHPKAQRSFQTRGKVSSEEGEMGRVRDAQHGEECHEEFRKQGSECQPGMWGRGISTSSPVLVLGVILVLEY